MKTNNWAFTAYDKKDNVIDNLCFIIEDRTEREAEKEAMHFVEQNQIIQDWSITPITI